MPRQNKTNDADTALSGQSASPDAAHPAATADASLTADDGLIASSAAGLTYPWGDAAPAIGETIRIADSVSWARLPLPGALGHINSWLLDDDGGTAIVDTGLRLPPCSDAWEALFAGALADTAITRIICTHMHPDHIGLAGWLVKRFGVPLHMTRGEWLTARLMVSDVRDEPPAEVTAMQRAAGWDDAAIEAARAQGWGRLRRVVHHLPYGYSRMVEGQLLSLGPHDWRVVIGSGHSPEHACLLGERDGVLIAGDQILPRISSNVSLSSGEPDANPLGEWLASIAKLMQLPADLLVCPAHGEPFRGLHVRLRALHDEHHERLDAMVAALDEPRRAVDCFPLLFKRVIGDEHRGLATGEALAHLRYLEVDGRVTRDVRDGVWWWHAV
ncbi:MAG: MBL fold metallo-hydrolase [Pseudomonadota bacterium]